jgi:hypothetical protein
MLPQRVYLAPQGEPLEFEVKGDPRSAGGNPRSAGGNYVEIALPPVGAHSVVVIE